MDILHNGVILDIHHVHERKDAALYFGGSKYCGFDSQ